MSTDTLNPQTPEEPEAPTNRPPSMRRVTLWLRRPYARRVLILTVVIGFLLLPLCWLILAGMNQTGAPASEIMKDIEQTVFVFTLVSIPITAFVFAVLLYSLLGWRRVTGDEPPMQDSPAIRTNTIGVILWTATSSILAMFLVVWGLIELAQITANSYGSISANEQPGQSKSEIINVTGQQWVWTFEYPQHDANPGAITQAGVTANKLGTFNVRCAELCGMHHAYMQTEIRVLEQDAFDSWVRESGGKKTS